MLCKLSLGSLDTPPKWPRNGIKENALVSPTPPQRFEDTVSSSTHLCCLLENSKCRMKWKSKATCCPRQDDHWLVVDIFYLWSTFSTCGRHFLRSHTKCSKCICNVPISVWCLWLGHLIHRTLYYRANIKLMPVYKATLPNERRDRTESPNSKCRMKWKSKSTSNRKITKWRETANFLCTAKSEPWPSDQPVQTTQSAKKLNHEISGWSHRSHFPWPSQSLTCLRHFLQQA